MKRIPLGADEGACRSCGKRVFWIVAANGSRVPLDAVAPTYQLEVINDASDPPRFRWVRVNEEDTQEPAFVNHFATCANASEHSRRPEEK